MKSTDGQPPGAPVVGRGVEIGRFLLLTAGSGAILLLLQANGWVDIPRISAAIRENPAAVLGIALTQLGIVVASPVRYRATLQAFRLQLPFRNVITACTVSACIAPWLPGSAAAGEAIRTGLLLARGAAAAPMGRVLAATGVDNGIRLFLELAIGFWAGVLLLLTGMGRRSAELGGLVLILGMGWTALGALPLLLLSGPLRWLPIPQPGLQRFIATVRDGLHLPRALLPSFLYGLAPTLLNALGFFLAAQAVHARIDLLSILVVYPLLLIGSLFPLGIAGIGGNQLITVGAFALLEIPGQDATSAELLHTGVVLVLNGLILLPFLPRLLRILHARDPHLSRH